ncbi:MAG: hypothetical protein ABIP53_10370 [Candidatus Limnocylindrales bacterium]
MTILAGIIGMAGRFAGQVLNTTLGWATLLLFGKVPQRKQVVLLIMVFGSLLWVALMVGTIFPTVGSLLIAAVPLKDAIGENWIRLGMLIGALIVPLLIGIAAVFVTEPSKRPKGLGLIVGVLLGYPFAATLSLILVLLAGVGTVRKVRSMMRRWEDAHVPIIVKPGAYEEVFGLIERKLDGVGLDLTPRDAGPFVSGPPKLLDLIAGRALGELVPDKLMLLAGKNLEILVYPSDLAISGTHELVARARAAVVTELTEAPAYMTTSAEAQKFEDELEQLGPGASKNRPEEMLQHVRSLDKKLARLAVPWDEWETLYRMRLQMERDALVSENSGELGGAAPGAPVEAVGSGARPASRFDLAIGAAGAALIALDLALLLGNRRRAKPE